jgi:lipid-A-disaccharide synthase-like uncharacterized protein
VSPGVPFIALQVWDGVGWLGQALFTARMLHQWLVSERVRRSVLPTSFWWLSLGGALCLAVYQVHRGDPVFLAGALVTLAIYGRNLWMASRPEPARTATRPALLPVLLGLLAFAAVGLVPGVLGRGVVDPDASWAWLALGSVAQILWSGRFVWQWVVSERLGRSVLPASFFWMSLVGALLLFAYAVYRVDWVMMAAYALNPIPYARNLVLLRRERDAGLSASGPRGG